MNNNFEAIENITMIKETIDNSKIYYKGLYKLCFISGIYHTILFILRFFSAFYPKLPVVNIFLIPILTGVFLIGYLNIYTKEKYFSNKYYLSIINSWAFITFIVPICITTTEFIQYFYLKDISSNSNYLYILNSFSNVLLFTVLIIVYSYLANKKYLKILAIMILLTYLILNTCFNNKGIQFSFLHAEQVILNFSSIYYFLFICIGYLGLALFLKKKAIV